MKSISTLGNLVDMENQLIINYIGTFARIQGLIELVIQMKIRGDKELEDVLGADYFERLTDAQRMKWLKSLLNTYVETSVQDRIDTVFNQSRKVRNTLVHRPPNLQVDMNEAGIGVLRHSNEPIPSVEELSEGLMRMEWLIEWITWLASKHAKVFKQFDGIEWVDFEPALPSASTPS